MAAYRTDSQNTLSKWLVELVEQHFDKGFLIEWRVDSDFDSCVTYGFKIVQRHLILEIEGFLGRDLPAIPTTADDVTDFLVSGNLGNFTKTLVRIATPEEQAIAHECT